MRHAKSAGMSGPASPRCGAACWPTRCRPRTCSASCCRGWAKTRGCRQL